MENHDLLLHKLEDGIGISQRRPWFLGFLNEEEAAACEDLLKHRKDVIARFYGGREEAQRLLLGLFPDYLEPNDSHFPLSVITATYREEDTLTHRDFLGALMSLGMERSVVGDILPGRGSCVFFLRSEMTEYVMQNLQKIGRVGVKLHEGLLEPLQFEQAFQSLSGVVASERLDCVTAFLCHTGRNRAAELITAGAVLVNHREILSVSHRLEQGDVLSIRKHGKFYIERFGPQTAKGRLAVACKKYL